jgi:diguanylate cyclase (GGDEF)-like protein/putative nucleotidyltransferase with HDIG domain
MLALAPMAAAALTALFFSFTYRLKRQAYLLYWTWAWAMLALHYLLPGLQSAAHLWPDGSPWVAVLPRWLLGCAALIFLASAQRYAQAQPQTWLIAVGVVVLSLWAFFFGSGWLPVGPKLGVVLVFVGIAALFLKEGRKQESVTDKLLALAFVFWGVILLNDVFAARSAAFLPGDTRLLVLVPQFFVALLMVMALYEEEKRRVERNMLALSHLNLTTSSFLGVEIQKMLSQALERVLSVVRLPSGALFLQHGDPYGQTSVVAVGLSDKFCVTAQKEKLDNHLVGVVARLGGLVVFRPQASWARLEREDAFRRFRKLGLAEGLQTVVGISLQAKERVFGVLLLGTPDNRRFTPAELRLLLALGHQIGMAVENSYLIQQTSRRTEELHILNEIGRALSSTLDLDTLFETIFNELRRLMDVSSFYIAFYDPHRDEVRFELEVVSNVRLAKRSRPAGNHLTEYLIRTRQPVLIRDSFAEEARRIGVDPLQQTGCFCGVPLVLYDRAIGAMAVHTSQERVFDEGHLELMRVLASQAGVAIENARLFSEEQKKARHLTLLNNVSRHGITTLNVDEMLARIAQEMEQGLTYDHIGIAMVDYTAREMVVEAEAGRRREALGRRIVMGEGVVGQVARGGQMIVARELASSGLRPVLSDSASATALPIVYADQLLGVLYVETAEPAAFPDEEMLLLRTLADVVAGALHNALTFQKAQEQAITDGLTGVKTHRFFMEALSSEWKRSTRAGRSFSLVLMDLDRFKFVNDFYGHLVGDTVLQRIGQILEQNCRRSDVVARYGGDEFVILMPETNLDQSIQLANKLRAWIVSDSLLHEKNITASFGIASFPAHGSTPQELIQVADSSMYISKHQGGNAVSTAENLDPAEARRWKRDVLEAYLGVTLKRLFSTGPEAFDEIYRRLEQFAQSLNQSPELAPIVASTGFVPRTLEQVPPVIIETITSLASAVDAKDHYTQGHSQKVSGYAVLLARALSTDGQPRFSDAEVEEIRLAGLLHDVGKVGIPESVLNKNGPLDAEEWEIMKTHSSLGARMLEPLRVVGMLQKIIRHHHEYFDGSGYPDRLQGESIPIGARVIAIADAFDTITSDRTYKKARSVEEALLELERCGGAQFDPALIKIFVELMRQRPPLDVAAGASASRPDPLPGTIN